MRVAIMGAGAIGLLYGGWLQQGGADVTFIARGQRLKSLRNSPLWAQGRLPFKLDRVTALECPKSTEPVDVVLLCVKLYDVEQAAAFALPALKPGGTLIGIQNGVNVLDLLKPLLPARQLAVGPSTRLQSCSIRRRQPMADSNASSSAIRRAIFQKTRASF